MTASGANLSAALHGGPGDHPTLAVLAAFVAINTVMYVSLALIKTLPRVRISRRLRRKYVRSETRSIHPALGWTESSTESSV